MSFFSLILTPNDVNSCINMFRQHTETLCPKCGINKTVTVKKTLRLTMAVIDIDYGAFIRRPMDWPFEYETPQFVLNNRFKFTLKMKSSESSNKQEVILCHLHEGNKYQSNIDVQLDSGSSVVFSCQQTCSIHLSGYYLN